MFQPNFSIQARAWLSQHTHCTPDELSTVQLKGSTSSSVYLVRCQNAPMTDAYVLRVIDNPGWLADVPDLAAREAAALKLAARGGLNTPRLVAFSNEDVGFGWPVVLMTFLQGHIDLKPADFENWLDQLARELAAIHSQKAVESKYQYQTWVDVEDLVVPSWTSIPQLWERAIELWQRGAPNYAPVLIHRDYHPTNVLWLDGKVSGMVDWINGCRGPAGVDVGHCRTNLAQMYGVATADRFLKAYQKYAPEFEYNVYWDLDTLLDMSLPTPTYYAPWAEFGLPALTTEEIQKRVDAYLGSLMERG